MKLSGILGFAIAAICIMALLAAAVIMADTSRTAGPGGKSNEFVNNPIAGSLTNTSNCPPDEAISACTGKLSGNVCQFKDRDGLSSGVCDSAPGILACAPGRQQNPGQNPNEKPAPQAIETSPGIVKTGTVQSGNQSVPLTVNADKGTFVFTSDASVDGYTMPAEYTCDGYGATPAQSWSGTPAGTKEFALIMTTLPGDGSTKWNWVLYNIPGTVTSLAKNSSGVGTTGTGNHGTVMIYDPPCSQGPGAKIYTYTLYALSASPSLPATADQVTGPVLTNAISSITLGKASYNLSYSRPF